VRKGNDDLSIDVTASYTIQDLKEAIDKKIGIVPADQVIYFLGSPVTEPDTLITELLEMAKTFNLVIRGEDVEKRSIIGGSPRGVETDSEMFLITGEKSFFRSKLLKANSMESTKLNSKRFAVVQDIAGKSGPSSRILQMRIYEAEKNGSISLKQVNGVNEVFLEPQNGDKEPLAPIDNKKYEESLSEGKMLGPLDRARLITAGLDPSCAYKVRDGRARQGEIFLKKTYQCLIDVDYPESIDGKQFLKERLLKYIIDSTKSTMDLSFVKEILLTDHAEELACLDFEELQLEDLPWNCLALEMVDIKKGSAILEFNLGFKDPPQNEADLSTYRVIELVILTIIENLQFIKRIKNCKWDENNLVLSAKFEVNRFDQNNYEEIIKQTMSSLRGSLSFLNSETPDTVDEQVERYLEDLLKNKSKELKKLANLKLNPESIRRIIRAINDLKLTGKDLATVGVELHTNGQPNKSELVIAENCLLFPYDFRKLADLEPQRFKEVINLTRNLPQDDEVWYKFFVANLDVLEVEDMTKIGREANSKWPYPDILNAYNKKGGTLGGLLSALQKFKVEVSTETEKNSISSFVDAIEELREKMYENVLENAFCPSESKSIQNLLEFQKMARNKLKIKTNPMQSFQALESQLNPGDQLWIFHQRPGMRSYAHVVVIIGDHKFVHATSPKRLSLTLILKSKIKEEDQQKLNDEKFCFVVRPSLDMARNESVFGQRATSCIGICFDYDPESANCETFCNGVHGIWEQSVQGQDLRGVVQQGANLYSKLVPKRKHERLSSQMEKIFQEKKLLLTTEIFTNFYKWAMKT